MTVCTERTQTKSPAMFAYCRDDGDICGIMRDIGIVSGEAQATAAAALPRRLLRTSGYTNRRDSLRDDIWIRQPLGPRDSPQHVRRIT